MKFNEETGDYEYETPGEAYAEHMGRRELDDAWRCDESLAALDDTTEWSDPWPDDEDPPEAYVDEVPALRLRRRLPRLFRFLWSPRGN